MTSIFHERFLPRVSFLAVASALSLMLAGCGSDPVIDPALAAAGRFPSEVPSGFALHDLGMMNTHAGVTEDFTFHATEETRAFHVVGVSEPDTFVLLMRAVAPDGTVIVNPDAPEGGGAIVNRYTAGFPGPFLSPNRAVPRPRAAATLIPNTPQIAMEPGDWSLRMGVFKIVYDDKASVYANTGLDATVHVGIVERQIDPPVAGKIDLLLSFASDSSISADDAPTHPTLQAALKQVDESLGSVGVRVGTVTYQDISDIPDTIELSGPACLGGSGTEEIFDLAPEPPPGVMHLIFSDRFHCELSPDVDLGVAVGGISNGIPGIPFARRDGMLVSTNLVDDYPGDWSRVVAHELSHFLGLFHTCEGLTGVCDNIADTPEGAEAAANLMFPNVSASTSQDLTPEQGMVLRLSPLVHPM
ncbi:Hypothetical protein A7982_11287 [Minicystis rosea]|nr:Hypothetical protein A7982_11287 [Minicystis rosea]